MKPLDFVKTKMGNIGIITEVTRGEAAIEFLGESKEKFAWWADDELEVIDNLPDLLCRRMCHPAGRDAIRPYKK